MNDFGLFDEPRLIVSESLENLIQTNSLFVDDTVTVSAKERTMSGKFLNAEFDEGTLKIDISIQKEDAPAWCSTLATEINFIRINGKEFSVGAALKSWKIKDFVTLCFPLILT